MNNLLPDFYLASSEGYDMEEPRKCYKIKKLNGIKNDYLLIKIDPPIIGQKYGLGGKDIDKVLVFTRHVGASLFPINKWPVYVHVARLLIENPESIDKISPNEYHRIAWAELYQTEEKARNKDVS